MRKNIFNGKYFCSLFILLALLTISSTNSLAVTFSPAMQISNGGTPVPSAYNPNLGRPLRMHVGPSGTIYVTWKNTSTGKFDFIKSANQGKTWTMPAPFIPVTAVYAELKEAPNGTLYAAYLINFTTDDRFYLQSSINGGTTWTSISVPSVTVLGASLGVQKCTNIKMGLSHSGKPQVIWMDTSANVRTEPTFPPSKQTVEGGFYIATYDTSTNLWGNVARLASRIGTKGGGEMSYVVANGYSLVTIEGNYDVDWVDCIIKMNDTGIMSSTYYSMPADPLQSPQGCVPAPLYEPCNSCVNTSQFTTAIDRNGAVYTISYYKIGQGKFENNAYGICTYTVSFNEVGVRTFKPFDIDSGMSYPLHGDTSSRYLLAATGNGHLYTLWQEGTVTTHIYIKECANCAPLNSGTWSAAQEIGGGTVGYSTYEPQIATGPNGEVYAAWYKDNGRAVFTTALPKALPPIYLLLL